LLGPKLSIGDEVNLILELVNLGNLFQQIDTVAFKSLIPRLVGDAIFEFDEWRLLMGSGKRGSIKMA
jgi:hypothetical protein